MLTFAEKSNMKRHLTQLYALILTGWAGMTAVSMTAQTALKAVNETNPISTLAFSADPTAIEHEGRIYVYGSNDQQQYEAMDGKGDNTYGYIKSLLVFSSADMQNWTCHGAIDVSRVARGSWFYCSWAPSVVKRTEADGLTHFYMYFSNGGSVGVLTATHPLGPWTDPLGKALISASTTGLGDCSCPFDPGACIDADGNGWLTFGGGSVNKTGTSEQPGNARIVRLGDDMVSLASDIAVIQAPYHFEANELNLIGGRLVYTYCSRWDDPNAACSMNYMVCEGDDPLQADSWTWKGAYLKNPGTFGFGYGNNHTHLHEAWGNWYLFYHNMKMLNAMGTTEATGFRSIGVNSMTVGESIQKLYTASMSASGVSKVSNLNPYIDHTATEMCTGCGLGYDTHPDYQIVADTLRPVLKVHDDGAWLCLKNVALGADGASRITLSVKGTGTITLSKNALTTSGNNCLGSVSFAGLTDFTEVTIELDPAKAKSTVTLYMQFTDTNNCEMESWRCSPANETAISQLHADAASARRIYSLSGFQFSTGCYQGLSIRK